MSFNILLHKILGVGENPQKLDQQFLKTFQYCRHNLLKECNYYHGLNVCKSQTPSVL